MKKTFMQAIALMVLMATMVSVFAGCGGGTTSGSNAGPVTREEKQAQEQLSLTGDDAFEGESFSEMIWGYYEADCYEYNGSNEDAQEFLTDMEFITLESNGNEFELAALPLTMQAGKYSHFMGSFAYEGTYYEPYTELGKSMFRKAYMAEVGDLTEEQFQKIEDIMQLDVVSVVMAQPNGATRSGVFAYTLKNNSISLYDLSIDDDYNITTGSEPFVSFYFLHSGGKLSLLYKDVQRDYVATGYKESDPSLDCSGYALNEKNMYDDLEGFSFYRFGKDEDITVYVHLTGGKSPVDPVMEIDDDTGAFTISWEQTWVYTLRGLDKVDDARTISGTIIPCTNYGFTSYCGMLLLIDGTCYRYLMSQQEYDELHANTWGDVDDSKRDELDAAKTSILEALKKALDEEGIEATIDMTSGKVTLEANFLFATNSSEVSAEGQDYLNRFIKAYTSVVLGESYGNYISNIIIEGHTDTTGSYSLNQKLSEERANAVAAHCISQSASLANVIQTKGCSYDFPVYNEDGTVNMAKSRRVTFSFVFADM